MTALYTARATAVGSRLGRVVSSDNVLDLDLKTPKELGGSGGYGTNPEQLFAAGYSACFDSALNLVIRTKRVKGVTATAVSANVSILKNDVGNGFKLAVELEVEIEGVDKETGKELVEAAHQVCPYSNATRGNIEVTLKIV
ncbi:organic hydroperoxide resistance protein [Bacillus cereus]|uniref:Ohr subfamily peroxiredoxin n=1 Tax=Bacillus anthracis TaxID=1392 RepID=A0A2B0WRB8_BACAN|nr:MULTISPECIES: organic hydroperoxide resistance protein [Bacillus]MBJ8061918.1 organic hydroperoxide resistance protein [Bacillus cereus]MCU0097710.1 organic hydroperoxide resistance protein [Bacillus sp. OR9]MCU5109388.1 organic hydroperoxide resistance protein [Bacillus cereus]PFL54430.1 Ohr subfamily peroxiredoxin [Bacillus anthracis]